jgi:hypothetical protein
MALKRPQKASKTPLTISRVTPPAQVQKQLGHHSISMTVDIYRHGIPGEGRERLDEVLGPKGKPGNPLALV